MRLIDNEGVTLYAKSEDGSVIKLGHITKVPTVDTDPIWHGHWEAFYAHEEPTSNVYRCSNCGKGFADYLDDDYDYYNEYPVFFEYDRCPHCGAIMDGDTVFPPYRPDGEYGKYWEEENNGNSNKISL